MSAAAGLPAANRPQLRSIACVGFDWRAEVSLKETLALLQGRTVDRWQYSSEPNADVLVYESSNALAAAIVRRIAAAPERSSICFPSSSDDPEALTLRAPFGASRLMRCLDHASQQLAGTRGAAGTGVHLGQRLDNLLQTPGLLAISIDDGIHQGLLIPNEGRLYWPVRMNLDEIAGVLGADVELHALTEADRATLRHISSVATIALPAEALLWAIGILRSGSTLLRRLPAAMPYRLRRWPDFGVLGRRPADLRCTSLLMQRALPVGELATLTNLPLGVAAAFVNACALCGLLENGVAETAVPVATHDTRFGGVLRRIRHAFALD